MVSLAANAQPCGGQPTRAGSTLHLPGGLTWSPARQEPALSGPLCQGSICRYSWPEEGKSRILFANAADAKERVKMTVRLSVDEGKIWPVAKLLHAGRSAYSDLAVLPDGTICCLYEAGKEGPHERIMLARFPLEWLAEGL